MHPFRRPFALYCGILFALALAAPLPAAPSVSAGLRGTHILFVVSLASKAHATDVKVQQHLESLGCVVKMADDVAPVTAAEGQDLVVISATVSGKNVEGRFKSSPTPVLLWESNILDDMSMTGRHQDVDWGEDEKPEQTYLWLVNAPHPLAGGLPNGLLSPFAESVKKINWGKPGLGAAIIATLPGEPAKAVIFGYETGAIMDYDFPAPARRVMFFLHNATFDNLNAAGLKLFDAAVLWAAGKT
jgi:hypothetical protein